MKTTFTYDKNKTAEENGNALAEQMKQFAKHNRCAGYWFDYGGGEIREHGRFCNEVRRSGYFMAGAIENLGHVAIFRNLLGNVAATIVQ